MNPGPRTPWLALGILGLAFTALVLARAVGTFHLQTPPCPLKALTGIPCATCGGTRCALALAAGNLREAFHWHPVLAAVALLSPVVLIGDLVRAWRRAPYPALPENRWARLGGILLVAATWILQVARGI
jgi:hypothetical protein